MQVTSQVSSRFRRSSGALVSSERHFPFGSNGVPFVLTRTVVDKRGLEANGRGLADERPTPTDHVGCKTPESGLLTDKDTSSHVPTTAVTEMTAVGHATAE